MVASLAPAEIVILLGGALGPAPCIVMAVMARGDPIVSWLPALGR